MKDLGIIDQPEDGVHDDAVSLDVKVWSVAIIAVAALKFTLDKSPTVIFKYIHKNPLARAALVWIWILMLMAVVAMSIQELQ